MISRAAIKLVLRRVLAARGVHFILLGTVIFAVQGSYQAYQQRHISCLSAAQQSDLFQRWQARHGRAANAQQRAALQREALDQRMLVREAMLLGWHKRDPLILQRLQAHAELLEIEGNPQQQLAAALALNLAENDQVIRRRLQQRLQAESRRRALDNLPLAPPKPVAPAGASVASLLSFQQRFFSADEEAEARQALAALASGRSVTGARSFIHGQAFRGVAAPRLRALFGDDAAQVLLQASPDTGWFGPVASDYGLHLFRITGRALASAVEQGRSHWQEEHVRAIWQAELGRMRARYRVSCNDQ